MSENSHEYDYNRDDPMFYHRLTPLYYSDPKRDKLLLDSHICDFFHYISLHYIFVMFILRFLLPIYTLCHYYSCASEINHDLPATDTDVEDCNTNIKLCI